MAPDHRKSLESETSHDVVVDHPGRLHERVADGGPDELETAFFQILAQGV